MEKTSLRTSTNNTIRLRRGSLPAGLVVAGTRRRRVKGRRESRPGTSSVLSAPPGLAADGTRSSRDSLPPGLAASGAGTRRNSQPPGLNDESTSQGLAVATDSPGLSAAGTEASPGLGVAAGTRCCGLAVAGTHGHRVTVPPGLAAAGSRRRRRNLTPLKSVPLLPLGFAVARTRRRRLSAPP